MTILFTLINILFIFGFCYLFHKVLSNMFKKLHWLNRISSLKKITLLISTILLYTLFIYLFFYFSTIPSTVNESFSEDNWFENMDSRYKMIGDIRKNKIVESKSKKEIIDLLGRPKNDTISDVWYYDLGSKGEWFGWKFYNLKMNYDKGYVTGFEVLESRD